jgi:2-oxoglutarate dehydrogenase E1 component
MHRQYLQDPASVDPSWAQLFAGASDGSSTTPQVAQPAAEAAPATAQPAAPMVSAQPATSTSPAPLTSQARVEPQAPAHSTAPNVPGSASRVAKNLPDAASQGVAASAEPQRTPLRGASARTAVNMAKSLQVPTATSVREIPMKLVIDQREMINHQLASTIGGKISFTHLIAYAMIQAIKAVPEMNNSYEEIDSKPFIKTGESINLGVAIDLEKSDGTRQLLVPNIKDCQARDFASFWREYERIIRRARAGQLTLDDFAGTTVSITNPGGIGTSHSVPRLLPGQGVILGVGSIAYPPEFQGSSTSRINELGVSKVTTLTSTYDHRIIQGAQSGEFLKHMNESLLGQHGFFDEIFQSLRVPYTPIRWTRDASDEGLSSLPRGARVISLINAYRTLGHFMADIDPLEYRQRTHPELAIEHHGLSLWDLDRSFGVGDFAGNKGGRQTMREILARLRSSYCRSIGIEYMHISNSAQRAWVQELFEKPFARWPREEYLRILDRLNEAEIFETFLQTKYVGQKRFSLEGGESAIVFLDQICDEAAETGLDEVIIGMPHRGRLNVLANIVGKSYTQIFREFEGNFDPSLIEGSGDVKYHLGSEGLFTASSGKKIRTSLAANPSHLEAVNSVVEGIARAALDREISAIEAAGSFPVLPVLVHGDAAFAGQGVVYETMQMSQLRAYKTGGTIHLVINNQVGFTTAPIEARSSTYATDLAKAWECPIFHVNGDDPEAVARVAQVAFAFRQQFHKDVVIDLVCYRRRGHNEGDDPSFTQPAMYDLIEQKRSVRQLFTAALIGRGDISQVDADEVASRFRARLDAVFSQAKTASESDDYRTAPYYPSKLGIDAGTAISPEAMQLIANAHLAFPPGFTVHPTVLSQLQRRANALAAGPIDWATAELLAMGSLLLEGRPVRLVGQDSRRGTFSQRFAAVVDRQTGEAYVPLKHLCANQGQFFVYDSLLSEYAAMAFEYGYSLAAPEALVCWEAQFGDFANGAQTIIDEFIAAGQSKWTQKSGVTLLLPHGFEGQGPDHSSARIERWLSLCAEDALALCQPSTPASYFHLLRQHAYVDWHRPLIIATPKSMLRNRQAVSQPSDFTGGRWLAALGDPAVTDPSAVRQLVLCSGKVRWELTTARENAGLTGKVAIIPLERLYPLPISDLAAELAKYPQLNDLVYAQEEPENQGAWPYLRLHLLDALREELPGRNLRLRGVTRPASSAPAAGSLKVHIAQENELLAQALG